jgi:hypothetical protein
MRRYQWSFHDAFVHARQRRPCINMSKFEDQLLLWQDAQCNVNDDRVRACQRQTVGRDKDVVPQLECLETADVI